MATFPFFFFFSCLNFSGPNDRRSHTAPPAFKDYVADKNTRIEITRAQPTVSTSGGSHVVTHKAFVGNISLKDQWVLLISVIIREDERQL